MVSQLVAGGSLGSGCPTHWLRPGLLHQEEIRKEEALCLPLEPYAQVIVMVTLPKIPDFNFRRVDILYHFDNMRKIKNNITF